MISGAKNSLCRRDLVEPYSTLLKRPRTLMNVPPYAACKHVAYACPLAGRSVLCAELCDRCTQEAGIDLQLLSSFAGTAILRECTAACAHACALCIFCMLYSVLTFNSTHATSEGMNTARQLNMADDFFVALASAPSNSPGA